MKYMEAVEVKSALNRVPELLDVQEQVESGMAWEAIVEEWRGTLTRDAIAEAVRMAREALDGVATPIAYLKFKFFSWEGFN
jgi:hypothetical protein